VKISIIIPTRNRADILNRCLDSITNQSYSRDLFEVIVVDNGSTDHTRAVVEAYSARFILHYISAPEPGLHVGRHAGLRHANSEILVFADDDIEALPGWIEGIADSFESDTVAMVGGNNYPFFDGPVPVWLDKMWNRRNPQGRSLGSLSIIDFGEGVFDIDPGYVWGCNFSIRKSVLLDAGGFHPDGVPRERLRFRGDGESHVANYVRSQGLRTVFNSQASVYHLVSTDRMTPEYFCKRAYAQGVSDSFSDVRAIGRVSFFSKRKARRYLRSARLSIEHGIRALNASSDPVDVELARIQKASDSAYWQGYRYHQREMSSDPELLTWVLKENYL